MKQRILKSSTLEMRVAGILMLLCLIIPMLNWKLFLAEFCVEVTDIELLINQKELIFRINIMFQLLSAVLALLLGYSLFRLLKAENESLTAVAFLLKLLEAISILILAFFQFVVLLMFKSKAVDDSFLLGFLENHIQFTTVSGVLMAISMLLFTIVFVKSHIIPKSLAILGIVAYILIIFYDGAIMLSLKFSANQFVQIIAVLPLLVFQFTAGIYLIQIKKQKP